MAKKSALTVKQRKFCELYVATGKMTESYLAAGYAKNKGTCANAGNLIRFNRKVKAYIDELQAKFTAKAMVKAELRAEHIIEELRVVAMYRECNLLDDYGNPKEFTAMTDDEKASIGVKMPDKMKALDMLARNFGLFEADNNQRKPELSDLSQEELIDKAKRLAFKLELDTALTPPPTTLSGRKADA